MEGGRERGAGGGRKFLDMRVRRIRVGRLYDDDDDYDEK
jgi:hypothetical protein